VTIAIDGRSASGKSTLGSLLADSNDVALIQMDDFYRVIDPQERERLTPEEGVAKYFDWQRLRDDALGPLVTGKRATYNLCDWERDALGAVATLDPRPIVVVEGVYAARRERRDMSNLIVAVHTSRSRGEARQAAPNQSPSV